MTALRRMISFIVPLITLCSCIPPEPVRRESSLEIGMAEDEVLNVMGSPDVLYGPVINADGQTVTVWAYNAKNVKLYAQPPVWLFMADRKYVMSAPPGDWHRDSLFIVNTRFPMRSSLVGMPTDSLNKVHLKVLLGSQFLNQQWAPYRNTFFVGTAVLVKGKEFWYEGLLGFGYDGDWSESGPAGPGNSLFHLQLGLGDQLPLSNTPFSLYGFGGFTYAYAKITRYDLGSERWLPGVEEPIYDMEISETGHFWGGYARCGIDWHVSKTWYVGLGVFGTLTTSRQMLGRTLNLNAPGVALELAGSP